MRRLTGAVLAVCVALEIAFVLLDYHVNYARGSDIGSIRRLFNITREDALPAFFATTQTFLVALTAWLLFGMVRRQGAARMRVLGWLVVAAFFTYMAIDDGAKVHERVGTAVRVAVERATPGIPAGQRTLPGFFPSYPWQVVFLPAFAGLGLFTLVFLTRELRERTSRLLVLAGVSCFVVAVGLDFIEGLDPGHPWNVHFWIGSNWDIDVFARRRFARTAFDASLHFSKSLEETTEMFGTTLLWIALLRHLTEVTDELRIRFVPPRAS